jgi:hypothetical protein
METHPERIPNGVQRRDGGVTPFGAGDAMAAVCDMHPGPIPSSIRARLGKAAKELLGDGFPPQVVCAAMLTAVRMSRPGLVQTFALELSNASMGISPNWREYRDGLHRLSRSTDPELSSIYSVLRREA